MRLTAATHERVTQAVAAAESRTDGEIVTVVAARSDTYRDVGAHWAALAMLSAPAILAIRPGLAESLHSIFARNWDEAATPASLFTIALLLSAALFLLAWLAMRSTPLRLALTPPSTKARRVHRRAIDVFRASVDKRTRAATAVLLYLSLDERRAEIIAEEAIHTRVGQEVWGEAMRVLLEAVRDDRVDDGLAAAIERIGAILAEHFPRSADDSNELPDRLIEL
ncbi:putative membrane protein [Sphingomonas gellani]|uniref:Putative membrane protein n=1 Tax=Sphingomonas gellani TaxID=1166340 RepID=A0A1H7ZMV6_9SPHN|nr:hypothetical protein [Sphingomonas gellani]SEM58829.1 putative membrane protein [Sphingomonas gellani]